MSTPIIALAGQAGAGKDTVGAYLAKRYNAATIGLADPMKRFVKQVFGFTNDQMWGPSELRNANVEFTAAEINNAHTRLMGLASQFMIEVLPGGVDRGAALQSLLHWFSSARETKRFDDNSEKFYYSPRVLLQTLGTEWGRTISRTMWVDATIRTCQRVLAGEIRYTREDGCVVDPTSNYDYAAITDARFRSELLGVSSVNGISFKISRPSVLALASTVGIAGHVSEKELGGIPSHFYNATISNTGSLQNLFDNVDELMAIEFGDYRTFQGNKA